MNARERKTASGIAWSIGRALLQVVVGIGVGVTLARLLSPSEFGVMAIAMGFGYLAEALALHGVAAAVVQRSVLRRRDVDTALTLSLGLATAIALGLALLAPVLATWYDTPALEGVLWLLALAQFVALAGAVPRALLRRHLRFLTLAAIDFFSYLLGYAVVSIALAWWGFGVWSLAWGMLAWQLIATVWGWWVGGSRRWRLGWCSASASEMIPFGAAVSGKNLVVYGGAAIDSVWLGKLVSTAALGLYHRAHQLALLPLQRLGAVIAQVMFPAYALIQDQPEKLRRAYLEAQHTVALVCFPVLAALIVVPETVIVGFYGAAWQEAAPILRALAVMAWLDVAHHLAGALVEAKGQAARELRLQALQVLLAFLAVTLAAGFGDIVAVAWARVAVAWVLLLLMLRLALPLARATAREWLRVHWPGLGLALTVAAGAWLAEAVVLPAHWAAHWRLAGVAGVCALIYVLGLWRIPGAHQRWRSPRQ